jgi:peptide/nickel transport system substrate-binding protein
VRETSTTIRTGRLWAAVSAVAILATLAAACGTPAATSSTTANPTTSKPSTTTTAITTPATTTTGAVQAPKYGGTARYLVNQDVMGFDEAFYAPWFAWTTKLTEDEMMNGDWTLGPAGSNKYGWILDGIYNWDSKAPWVCESWEIKTPYHWVFKVKPGIRFAVNPNNEASKLTNGREITATDVVYSYDRQRQEPTSYVNGPHAAMMKAMKFTAVDKYTVDLEVPNDPDSIYNIAQIIVDWSGVVAKEVIDKYGNMKDWKTAHGTGPFFLTDYVPASSVSFTKNPSYWAKDPIGPGKGNQLPYLDAIKFVIIADTSTQLAALRTAKIDHLNGSYIQADDADSVKKTNPEISFKDFIPASAWQIYMRSDKQDLPYKDKRVRQALVYATDYTSIAKDFMKGRAQYPTFPITPMDDLKAAYLPLSESSAAVQDMYKYNPEKAKALLKDAGYPNGFKATVVTTSSITWNADYLSIIKQQWSKVGVDLNIQLVEMGVYNNRWNARNYDDLFFASTASSGTFRYMVGSQGVGGGYNLGYITDPRLADGRMKMMDMFGNNDDAGVAKLHKQLSQYIYEDAWVVNTPAEARSTFWWPWLKNYHGELAVGILNPWGWNRWVWLDQDLKKTMGK